MNAKLFRVTLSSPIPPTSLSINPPGISLDLSKHVGVLGPNASGKKSILNKLKEESKKNRLKIETVSFDTHRTMLKDNYNIPVARILGGLQENQDIVIRFGLKHIWWRKLKSLSTGEIRKVLLAKAVSNSPDILFLDRPFDGLDNKSRNALILLLNEITKPFQAKPLIQGIKWKDRPIIQVVLSTHRPITEIPSFINQFLLVTNKKENNVVITDHDVQLFNNIEQVIQEQQQSSISNKTHRTIFQQEQTYNNTLSFSNLEPVLNIHNLTIFPIINQDDNILDGKDVQKPLLNRVSWTVHPREIWWLQGENGASKSILLNCAVGPQNILKIAENQHLNREWIIEEDPDIDRRRKRPPSITCTDSIGIVSTERHISFIEADFKETIFELIQKTNGYNSSSRIHELVNVLGLNPNCLSRRFNQISCGEQKLVLLIIALVKQPKLLILDEPCQSLDFEHRQRVARIVDQICTSNTFDTACIFVTHYEDELPRVVSHRLVLSQGKVISRGPWNVQKSIF